MRKAIIAIAFASSAALAAPAPDVITRNLKPWAPDSVSLSDGTLQIVTPQDRVTQEIYLAVLGSGVCGSLWMNEGSWSGVKEVRVLNRHARQGYVFEGGEDECVQLGKLTGHDSESFMLQRTHTN